MASQAASSALFLALTRPGAGGASPSDGGALAAAARGEQGEEEGEEEEEIGDELHSQLQAKGGVVEALLPDAGGAHGVATSVHLFPRARLLRAGLPP